MNRKLVPNFTLFSNGQKLGDEVLNSVISITVDSRANMASMCTVKLRNEGCIWSDSEIFREGNALSIAMGYMADQDMVFQGEITGWKALFPRLGPTTLTVIGYDLLHRLRRGSKRRSFLKVRDSDLARRIASELGLKAVVDPTEIVHDYLFQNNQSNIDFLLERARRIGFELKVLGKELHFKKPQDGAGPSAALRWGENLLHFRSRINTVDQMKEIRVRGWNFLEKAPITGDGKLDPNTDADATGPAAVKKAFGSAGIASVLTPTFSRPEAEALASAQLESRSMEYVVADGECSGDHRLKLGGVVEIQGVGVPFKGRYYITEVKHIFTPDGYKTLFVG